MAGFVLLRRAVLGRVVVVLTCASLGLLLPAAPPAQAAACYGGSCDGQGPSGMGCMPDSKKIAESPSGNVNLRYSPSCHAMYAQAPTAPTWGQAEISIEMQDRQPNGTWITVGAYYEIQYPTDGRDWTLMFGARNGSYQFRAVYKKPNGDISYSPWRLGGVYS